MHDTPSSSAVNLPAGWTVERHRYARSSRNTGTDMLVSFIVTAPDKRIAVFHDIHGDNGLVWALLHAMTDGAEGQDIGAGPLSGKVKEPYALVIDRQYDGAGLSLAVHDGINFTFGDGDCFDRDGETLDGYTAEFLTHNQLERLLSAGMRNMQRKPPMDVVAIALRLSDALRKASPDDPLADEAINMLRGLAGPIAMRAKEPDPAL